MTTSPDVPLRLVRGDITEQHVDAIVNAANSSLLGGGGVDGAIHRRGGPAILAACRALRQEHYPKGLPTGYAVATTAGELPAQMVVHTVGPVWSGGQQGEPERLAQAYYNSLACCLEHGLRTVAFPSISTGAYGFPFERAAPIALQTVRTYALAHPQAFDAIRFVLFTDADLSVYRQAWQTLTSTT
jgi:O-acetyl-ADP-ribose deacetylase (regulator of RNase III)